MSPETETPANPSKRRCVVITLLGWFVIVGLDLFQNAGVFATVWQSPDPAFLSPEKMFQRIPLGYLAFLISAGMLTWLMSRLRVFGWKKGALLGLKLGGLLSISWVLGLASVFPLKISILLAWFSGGLVQYACAAAIIGAGLNTVRLGRLSAIIVTFVILLAMATMALQNLGLAPAMEYR